MFNPVYVGVVMIGLLHGVEPGHGWPVATLYSVQKRKPLFSAIISSGLLGMGHLVSSIAVVVAYVLLQAYLDFQAPWLKYLAAALLLILAYRMFREKVDGLEKQHGHIHEGQPEVGHEHEHEHAGSMRHTHWHKHVPGKALSLWSLTGFAFVLGFAHEEEFALLALVAGGVNAWVLMFSYGLAVLLGLIAVTVLSVRIYKQLQPKLMRYEKYVPRIGAIILVAMAIGIVLW